MQQRREALQIRPLLEYPALREVMGLDGPAAVAVESTGRVVKHRSGGRRTPKDAAAPRSIWATTNRGGRSKPHPRFDRRALLESDNAS